MAAITSATSGLSTSTSTWTGGVVPVSTDTVTIAAGHTVTISGNHTWGNDTTTGVQVNGTLKASRSVSATLTVRGDLNIGASGTLDYGTEADPIPSGVVATMLLGDSASPAIAKYGIIHAYGAQFYAQGATRSINTVLIADAADGATSFVVADATGWSVGDRLILASPDATANTNERTISSITPGSGTTATIGCTALVGDRLSGCEVGCFSSNVIFKSVNTSQPAYINQNVNSTQGEATRCARYVLFENLGHESNSSLLKWSCWSMYTQVGTYTTDPYRFEHNAIYSVSAVSSCGLSLHGVKIRTYIKDIAFACHISRSAIFEGSGATADIEDCVVYRGGASISSSYSQGGQACKHYNSSFLAGAISCLGFNSAISPEFYNCKFASQGNRILGAWTMPAAIFDSCDFGSSLPSGSYTSIAVASQQGGAQSSTFIDCKFQPGVPFYSSSISDNASTTVHTLSNINGDITEHERWTPQGVWRRNNTVFKNSTSSLSVEPLVIGGEAATYTVKVPAPNGSSVHIVGSVRFDSAYYNSGDCNLPTVTISGLGITPVVFTATSAALNAWETVDISATNSSGQDGQLILTFSASVKTATGGLVYFDGIPTVSDFVVKARHYGYKFDEGTTKRTVDPVVTLSESAALAVTGCSYSSGKLTISGAVSLRDLYDWAKATVVANLDATDFLTSVDGVNIVLDADLEFTATGSLTGSGSISMPSHTLTFASGASSTVAIDHDAGLLVPVSVTGYTVGARIQLYDETTSTEIYNAIPAGAALLVNTNWTADHSLRLRMARVVGTDADQLIQTKTTLTATGASFVLDPTPDAVYEGNAIDGSTITEFAADYPNVQIDINDLDGETTPQRCYAWYMALQMTADGLSHYHGALIADDSLNYRIVTSVADLKAQNIGTGRVLLTGGRIYRDDGESFIADDSGSIHVDYGRSYVAEDIRREVQATLTIVGGI